MPIVTARQEGSTALVIIDGYHRSHLIQCDNAIRQLLGGYMSVVMKRKSLNWSNGEIGKELGMDNDEVLRMQQITGMAQAFIDNTFSTAWE